MDKNTAACGRLTVFWYDDFNICFMRWFRIFLSVALYATFPLKIPVMLAQAVVQKIIVHLLLALQLGLCFEPLK